MNHILKLLVAFYVANIQPILNLINKKVYYFLDYFVKLYKKHGAQYLDPYLLPVWAKIEPLYGKYKKLSPLHQKIIKWFLSGCVMAMLYSFFMGETPHKRNAPTVEIGSVRVASLRERATVIGSLVANQAVVLRAQVQGQITAIHFKGGQMVEKDQPLITLDDRIYVAALKEAEAQLKTAQADYDRMSKLSNSTFAPLKAKEQAEAKLKQAEANYETRKFQLEGAVIRAPFDGVVGLRDENLSIGALVDQRQDIVSVVDVDPIRIKFSVPSQIALKIQAGQKVKVIVDNLGSSGFVAEIDSIDARVSSGTNTLLMQAVADNPHGLLKPGLFGRVNIEAGTKDGTLVVPETCVDLMGEESFVYRIMAIKTKKGEVITMAAKTPVVTGLRENESIEIVSGLKESDLIITTGQMKLGGIDRAVVRVVNISEYPQLMETMIDTAKSEKTQSLPPPEDVTPQKKKKKKKKSLHKDSDLDDADDEVIEDVPLVPALKEKTHVHRVSGSDLSPFGDKSPSDHAILKAPLENKEAKIKDESGPEDEFDTKEKEEKSEVVKEPTVSEEDESLKSEKITQGDVSEPHVSEQKKSEEKDMGPSSQKTENAKLKDE